MGFDSITDNCVEDTKDKDRKIRDFLRPIDESSKRKEISSPEGNDIADMNATSRQSSDGSCCSQVSHYQSELPFTKSSSCSDLVVQGALETIKRRRSMDFLRKVASGQRPSDHLRKGVEGEAPVLGSQQETSIKHFDVIIIGAETSAVEYFNTLTKEDWQRITGKESPRVVVIGQRELWSHMEPNLQMGQPEHLLSLSGHNIPEYSTEFMRAGNYVANIENVRSNMSIFPYIVSSIEKSQESKKYRIKMQNMIFSTDKVIIATGPGPARQRENITVSQETAEIKTPYKKVISGSEYIKESAVLAPLGSKIAIEGGSATAAWAYEKALQFGYSPADIYWFTDSCFETAFPSGERNRYVQRISEGKRYAGRSLAQGLIVEDKVHLFFEDDPEVHVFDQYIVAIGADIKKPSGAWSILPEEIRDKLEAIHDINGYFYDDKESTIIGLASDDKSLLVVGAAAYNLLKARSQIDNVKRGSSTAKMRQFTRILQGDHQKYAQANKTLPTSASPHEGIPTVVATIEALNDYMPQNIMREGRINYNLANRTQLAAYLAREYPNLSPSIAKKFVEKIIKLRTNPETPFGMDQEAIRGIEQEMDQEAIRNIEQNIGNENSERESKECIKEKKEEFFGILKALERKNNH
jgi:hypothetical protein